MPEISVIVPIYHNEATLSRCLDSILNQTFDDFELIVVNDGSIDNGRKVAEEYAAKDSRIRIIDQENKGLGAARNTGIRNASGEYISCVDSDDIIKESMLEDLLCSIKSNDADIAICQVDNVLYSNGEREKSLGVLTIPGSETVASGREAAQLQLSCVVPVLFNSVCFKLVKRSLYIDNNIWFPEDFRYCEDWPTSVKLFLNSQTVSYVRKNLYEYIHETESLTTSYSEKKAFDNYLNVMEIIEYVQQNDPTLEVDNLVIGMIFPIEKHISRAAEPHTEKTSIIEAAVDKWRNDYRPSLGDKPIPLAQKIKILVAYHGLSKQVCRLLYSLRWMPYVKYMM